MSPWDLEAAHDASINHRAQVLASERCGCFHCKRTFAPGEIRDWTDTDGAGVGQTALCPRCGIDAVLGSAAGFPLKMRFLGAMHRRWFGAG